MHIGVIKLSFRETSISKHLVSISDPRIPNKTQHLLLNILTIVLCAVISGSEDFYDIEEYAESKREFLETFLDFPSDMPSHDTINRVISRISPRTALKSGGSVLGGGMTTC